MKWINTDNIVLIKSWCKDLEEGALAQVENLANHPCVFKHVAIMPDCHVGYGMPIGGVVALKGAVVPNFVGVDIGCGMCAVKTTAKTSGVTTGILHRIIDDLKLRIPVGKEHRKAPLDWGGFDDPDLCSIIKENLKSAGHQLGTLGSGNHFIEVQVDEEGYIWLMLHSGSRNIGYRIANHFHKKAVELCKRWYSPVEADNYSSAFLPIGTKEAAEYITSMNWALEFAKENRRIMMKIFKEVINSFTGCTFSEEINIHHNFAAIENHFRENVWVHRKGATKAYKGQLGIIPGSMGTASYIVRGLGNIQSFKSCSHGAGRNCGRAEFCKTHTVEECNESIKDVVFSGWGDNRKGNPDISEAPGAYKNIDEVIESQLDLVDIVTKLRPLAVMKG